MTLPLKVVPLMTKTIYQKFEHEILIFGGSSIVLKKHTNESRVEKIDFFNYNHSSQFQIINI